MAEGGGHQLLAGNPDHAVWLVGSARDNHRLFRAVFRGFRSLPSRGDPAYPARGKSGLGRCGLTTLSVVIPVYNEMGTIAALLREVVTALPDVPKQIIVVDDGSRDGTREWLRDNLSDVDGVPGQNTAPVEFIPVFHDRNKGKGAAVRTGFEYVTGDVIVIQDADLEYDPADWSLMLPLINDKKIADVVYGSRFDSRPHRSLYFHHYLGNRLISLLFSMLYNQTLSDIETCYKMFSREVLKSLQLSANDFGFEIQLSAQIALARRWRVYEVGISYYGRTYEEGKKINWLDGLKALVYLLKWRVA
jgi:glycosyltransferase involved in cell wall biosynthesis